MNLIKTIVIILGVTILFPQLVYHGVNIFVPDPKYRVDPTPYEEYSQDRQKYAEHEKFEETNKKEYREGREEFEHTFVRASIPINIVAILLGFFLLLKGRAGAVGLGLVFGSFLSLFHTYWVAMGGR